MRIVAFDQIDLPVALILFERLLAPARRDHALVLLVPDKPLQSVLSGEMKRRFGEGRSWGSMSRIVFMGGRDNSPAMTNLLYAKRIARADLAGFALVQKMGVPS
jgi:hypothetical protein